MSEIRRLYPSLTPAMIRRAIKQAPERKEARLASGLPLPPAQLPRP